MQHLENLFSLRHEPPFLNRVGRVIVASENKEKIRAVNQWLEQQHLFRGDHLLQADSRAVTGEEPSWDDAVEVAKHKVDTLVSDMEGEPGGSALVVGTDIVVCFNGIPHQNLSRQPRLNYHEELERVVETFSEDAIVTWDVVAAFSQPGLRVTVGNRQVAWFKPIPAAVVEAEFERDMHKTKNRNTRIDLAHMVDYINGICCEELHNSQPPGEDDLGRWWGSVLHSGVTGDAYELLKAEVIGGIPVSRMNVVGDLKPRKFYLGKLPWMEP